MHTLLSIFCRLSLIVALSLMPAHAVMAREYATAQPLLPQAQANILSATGESHRFLLELARSEEEKERGLMFRTALQANQGMIFLHEESRPRYMWMKNTLIPLDMLFLDDHGRIIHLQEDARPGSLDPVGTTQPVRAVVELQGGIIRKLGIRPGDLLRLEPSTTGIQP